VSDDAVGIFQGSAVTGKKYTNGMPFDVGRVSDFDIGIASSKLLDKAKELGVELRSGGSRTGALTSRQIKKLGLADLQKQLSREAGRRINFMLFRSVEAAVEKAPSIVVK
jgi:filamentous hemagglutinin